MVINSRQAIATTTLTLAVVTKKSAFPAAQGPQSFALSHVRAEMPSSWDPHGFFISTLWPSLPNTNTPNFLLHLEKNKFKKRGKGRKFTEKVRERPGKGDNKLS